MVARNKGVLPYGKMCDAHDIVVMVSFLISTCLNLTPVGCGCWMVLQHMGEKGAGRNGHVDARNLELNSLEILLKDVSPHRQRLWNGLVPNLM